ncbi:MAG: hypothetical protein IT222_01740 [Crocinitomix sp.]|nr:hypothetical protein [Crocinitomix sp.]
MNRIYLIFSILLITNVLVAQTEEIAYKSHSGNAALFEPSGQGNFGIVEPFPVLKSVTKLNDSTVVLYSEASFGSDKIWLDTLVNSIWSTPNLNIDSIQAIADPKIKFIGFEAGNQPINGTTENVNDVQKQPKKKKNKADKKNNLVGITGSMPTPPSNTGLLVGLIIGLMSLLVFWLSRSQNLTKQV